MKPVFEMEYHPMSEKLVQIMCDKTQNPNPQFFRVLVAYYFGVVASNMRCEIDTHDRGRIPINIYAINLGSSGTGKGYSTNIMEKQVLKGFRKRFLDETFELAAEQALPSLANARARKRVDGDQDAELEKAQREFNSLGPILFSFDSATAPAVKQLRHKFLMAKAGALSMQIDEIGSNLLAQLEPLTTFLELYDMGEIKPKLIKNTGDNLRVEEVPGATPANAMLFGTAAKLLDGSKTEEEFMSLLETGYARRSLFGMSKPSKMRKMTKEEIYALKTDKASDDFLDGLQAHFRSLADIENVRKVLTISKETTLELIDYELTCREKADEMPEHMAIRKMELQHRYFKALKLAGAYAFVDGSDELTMDHLHNAIKLTEDSGIQCDEILTRELPFEKLAKHLGSVPREVTHAELMTTLPYFKGGSTARNEMVTLAIAWGYRNSIIIKKSFSDSVEFLRGESLQTTNLDQMIAAASTDITENYQNTFIKWHNLHKMTQRAGFHWTSHHLNGGYRNEDNAIAGFNLIVLDVDKGVKLAMVRNVLKDYKYLIYTTKRHQTIDDNGNNLGDRFRILLPTNYVLKLDAPEYKEFMASVYESMPFELDTTTNQRARKWMSHSEGTYEYNDGLLFDVLPFIPKTSKNEERIINLKTQAQMDALQRWVINTTGDGNRNNKLHSYARILVDAGKDFNEIYQLVMDLNSKLVDKLSDEEIHKSILVTVQNAIAKRGS